MFRVTPSCTVPSQAVCFDEQFQADPVPVDAHDCAMDIVVTPTRVIRASERAQATAAVSGAAKTA